MEDQILLLKFVDTLLSVHVINYTIQSYFGVGTASLCLFYMINFEFVILNILDKENC